ncbi:hypothetical protein OsJ_26431 [Oryza sativa Japonica Group]|uniref:DUF4216 domain-containing protein n=1 Tax=Oryza sativa subsp. japonica TaxID=39947 RepID=A3BQP5_ORYSJ|nr:hypothetical protein OsJ_26431 [Oryza sativa Japonica Group]
MVENKTYYGAITEILELDYKHKGNIALFKCEWVDNRVQDKWIKVDKLGTTNVNLKHLFNTGSKLSDEPFILASQAVQVYYVEDPSDNGWSAVIETKPRDFYDMAKVQTESSDHERKIMARERGNENTTYLNEYERGRAERIKKNNIALQAIIQKRRELAKSSEGNLGSASTHQETRKRKRVDCAGSEPARHESGLPNLSRSTRRGTGSSTSTHDEDEELVANTNHLFMHDCERNDELAENGGKRMANGGGNENTTYVNEYERLRAERIKKNNIALQAVIEKKKELANLSEENLGSASTHQETRKRKVRNSNMSIA